MSKNDSKRALKLGVAVMVVLAAAAFVGFRYWEKRQSALPEGIVSGNGRIEATLIDVAAREPLRVEEVLVAEGDLVKPNQVLVRLDTTTLDASLGEAKASVAAAQENVAFANASIEKQKSEIRLAAIEVDRARTLAHERAGSQRDLDVRKTKLETTKATLAEAEAALQTSRQKVEVARANVATIQTRIDDAILKSPITGRVLYRLAEAGEVLPPGGKALTLLNLEDLYMTIFLPSEEAANVKIGAEGRITVDYDADHAVPGYVSFVSPEAQFTPKQVETRSEREKLMFRTKIQLPKELANQYLERTKTGVRGVGYVKVKQSAAWPPWLQNLVTAPVSRSQAEAK
jgi:HlyD family secretion protein